MKIAGIIAEYNPFHNGHAYQIGQLKEKTGADYIVAAMSGDFVQRGAPALMDKYARTNIALSSGVDLVIELPALWASASAEHFAAAGVALFDQMGCVDYLCFGAETENLPLLVSAAEILAEEPTAYQAALSSYLKNGMSFPLAREQALLEYCAKNNRRNVFFRSDELQMILSSPNNILALEYLKALHRRKSTITPILIKREGAGYHEESINVKNASASAIRKLLCSAEFTDKRAAGSNAGTAAYKSTKTAAYTDTEAAARETITSALTNALPKPSYDTVLSYQESSPFLTADDFSGILGYRLLCCDRNSLSATADCNADIANRLVHNRFAACSFTQFCELMKSRDITYSRMSRILMHLILDHTKADYDLGASLDYVPYLRILGFRKKTAASSEPLLSCIKKSAEIPLISKLAAAKNLLSKEALILLKKDIFAANLYEQVKFQKNRSSSLRQQASMNMDGNKCPLPKKAEDEYTRKLILL